MEEFLMNDFASQLEEKTVYILGPIKLQNTLLSSFLNESIGANCVEVEEFNGTSMSVDKMSRENTLFLWDCFGKDLQSCLLELDSMNDLGTPALLFGLFNVRPNLGIEEETVARGVRGFFYQDDSLEQFPKGISAMFRGELWISRKIMMECLLNEHNNHARQRPNHKLLTGREIEILGIIASGETNERIADKLCISPHTVKTHIYNIFKKIDVPNRLQAALWAAKNL
jgi:LuxR family transcriptional regulator of csgAB operon